MRGHREAPGDCVAFADEVDDRFGAAPAGLGQHRLDLAAVGLDEVMRAAGLGEFERFFRSVDDDDLRGAQRGEHLDADMSKAARADHDDILAGQQMTRGLLGRAIGGQSRVRIGSDILRGERLRQFDERALTCQQVLRVTAIGVDAGEGTVERMHVVAAPARQAMAAEVTSGWQMTLSPTLTPSTPGPTASTQPAFSCPMI